MKFFLALIIVCIGGFWTYAQQDCDLYVVKTYDDANKKWTSAYSDYIPLANSDISQLLGLYGQKYEGQTDFTFAFSFVKGKVCLGESIRVYIKFEGDSYPEILEFKSIDYTNCSDSYWVSIDSPSLINKFNTKVITKFYTDDKTQISMDVDWLTASVILTSNKCL